MSSFAHGWLPPGARPSGRGSLIARALSAVRSVQPAGEKQCDEDVLHYNVDSEEQDKQRQNLLWLTATE